VPAAPTASIDAIVTIRNNPVLISVRARVPWRVSTLCLVLSRFRGQKARLDHLHLVTWAVGTDGTRELLIVWLSGQRPMDSATVRIDSALPTTVALAAGEGLVGMSSVGKVELTKLGSDLASEIDAVPTLMQTEKAFLQRIMPLNETRLATTLGALAT